MVRAEKKKGTAPPMRSPTRTRGSSTGIEKARFVISTTVSRNEPKSDVAASTAVAMAIPFVMALVVFPTASRCSIDSSARPPSPPDIVAIPWALSATGPKVSIDTMTPTVVSMPMPVSEIE